MARTLKHGDDESLRVVRSPDPKTEAAPDSEARPEITDGPETAGGPELAGGPAKADAPTGGKRKYALGFVALALLAAAVWFGQHWWTVGRFIETTEDAYLQSDIVSLSVQVDGTVASVDVADNTQVRAGDTVLTLDPAPYEATLAAAEADVAVAAAARDNVAEEQRLQMTRIAAAQADVDNARSQLDFARTRSERAQQLLSSGAGTQVAVDDATAALNTAQAAEARATAALALAEGQVPILASQHRQREADLLRARASARIARIDLGHTIVTAPRDGVVGNRGTAPGEYLRPGTRFMSLVPTQDSYITANFKETQIENFRPGMEVEVEVDMLGGRVLQGTIDSIAAASGSEFSVLPPDNATGNFTKIVQRIPVRIHLQGDDLPTLRTGASVVVSVDTRSVARARDE